MSERFWHVLFNISLPSHNRIIKYCGDSRESRLCALYYRGLARKSVSYFYVSVCDRGLLMAVKGRVSIIQVRSIFVLFLRGFKLKRRHRSLIRRIYWEPDFSWSFSYLRPCAGRMWLLLPPLTPPLRLQHTAYRDVLYTAWTPLCLLIIEPLSY